MCVWLYALILYIYSSVCLCFNVHVIITLMYACMDSILHGPARYVHTYKIGPAPILSCVPLV